MPKLCDYVSFFRVLLTDILRHFEGLCRYALVIFRLFCMVTQHTEIGRSIGRGGGRLWEGGGSQIQEIDGRTFWRRVHLYFEASGEDTQGGE